MEPTAGNGTAESLWVRIKGHTNNADVIHLGSLLQTFWPGWWHWQTVLWGTQDTSSSTALCGTSTSRNQLGASHSWWIPSNSAFFMVPWFYKVYFLQVLPSFHILKKPTNLIPWCNWKQITLQSQVKAYIVIRFFWGTAIQ